MRALAYGIDRRPSDTVGGACRPMLDPGGMSFGFSDRLGALILHQARIDLTLAVTFRRQSARRDGWVVAAVSHDEAAGGSSLLLRKRNDHLLISANPIRFGGVRTTMGYLGADNCVWRPAITAIATRLPYAWMS
jgi:hypothetical protein